MLVPAMYQYESATDIHMFPPAWITPPAPTPFHPSRLSQGWAPTVSSLYHTANSNWLSILQMVMHIFSVLLFQFFHLFPSPTVSQVCSLCLHLHCCPANRFISTIFLDYIYICVSMLFVFLFLDYFTLDNRLYVHPPHWNWLKCVPFYGE